MKRERVRGEGDAKQILLKFPETRKWREELV
jgi:hypothetical protein